MVSLTSLTRLKNNINLEASEKKNIFTPAAYLAKSSVSRLSDGNVQVDSFKLYRTSV